MIVPVQRHSQPQTRSGLRSAMILLSLITALASCATEDTPEPAAEPGLSEGTRTPDDGALRMLPEAFAPAQTGDMDLVLVTAPATEARLAGLPQEARETAVVANQLSYVVLDASGAVGGGRINGSYMLGILINPEAGLVQGNLTVNPAFLGAVYDAASLTLSDAIIAEIQNNETGTVALLDQRAADSQLPLEQLIADVIGIYVVQDNVVYFQGNPGYQYFSDFGFMQLTPDIRRELYRQR